MSENSGAEKRIADSKEENVIFDKQKDGPTEIAMIDHMTAGFIGALTTDLDRVKNRLAELTQSQGILIETIQQENNKFIDCQLAKDLGAMVTQVKLYYIKLTRVKQDMIAVQERVTRLKKRAMKVQAQRDREEMSKAQAREKELEIERLLVAKPATESYTEPTKGAIK